MPPTISSDLTQKALRDFRAVFDMFDTDRDNALSPLELAQIMRLLGDDTPNDDRLATLIRDACDLQGNATVPSNLNFNQFLNLFSMIKPATILPEHELFKVLDRDDNGTVSADELHRTLNGFSMTISQDEADAMADVASARERVHSFGAVEFHRLVGRVRELRSHSSSANNSADMLQSKP